MEENWYALAISILKQCKPEQAFKLYETGLKANTRFSTYDIKMMAKYKEKGFTWEQIGDLFGLNASAAHKRVSRARLEVS